MIAFLFRVLLVPAPAYLAVGTALIAFAAYFAHTSGNESASILPLCPCDRHAGRIVP